MESDWFVVQKGDVIGWTNEQEWSLISFNTHPTYRVHFYSFPSGRPPAVNEAIEVEGIQYPFVFSVAVKISEGWV